MLNYGIFILLALFELNNNYYVLLQLIEKLYRAKWSTYDGLGAIVISPTRELALQTFEVLRKVGCRHHSLSAGLVIGGKHFSEEQKHIANMNIIIATPGRLLQHLDQTPDFNVQNLQMLGMKLNNHNNHLHLPNKEIFQYSTRQIEFSI